MIIINKPVNENSANRAAAYATVLKIKATKSTANIILRI
jgi:hypothetical protein